MEVEDIYKAYKRVICPECENKKTDLCHICYNCKGDLQCIYYKNCKEK